MKRFSSLCAAVILVLSLGGVALAAPLVVAHDTNFKPFEFKDESGKYTGFDIELWKALAERAGLEFEFQPMDFNGIIPGLQTAQVDVGIDQPRHERQAAAVHDLGKVGSVDPTRFGTERIDRHLPEID